MVGFCSSAKFVEHVTSATHPERPDRIRTIHAAVRAAGMLASPSPFPDYRIDLGPVSQAGLKLTDLGEPVAADEKWLRAVHSPEHIEHVRNVCRRGGGLLDEGDTPVGPTSFHVALLATGALLGCCDAVVHGRVKRSFAAVRPPGHHAEPDRPMGFCLFSNIAIAARYLQQAHGVGKIAIVDFDVHHGNGTQAVFETDPGVLFISLHQDPRTCYPGTGYASETGKGAGRGFTLNIPFDPGTGDDGYQRAFTEQVIPKLDAFAPEVLLISAGFDAHQDDPLAQIELSEEAFEQMTRMLVQVADARCSGRVVSALEGGYNLPALGRGVVRHLTGLAS